MVMPIAVSVGGIVAVAAVAMIIWRRRHRMPVIPFAELKQAQRLGAGHFGEVFQARWRSHASVAVKQSNVRCSDGAAIATERRRLEAIPQHAHVVRVYGICIDAPERGLCIVMELGVCSLEWLLQDPQAALGRPSSSAVEPFDAATALSIAQQVAEGLMHVHRSGVVHRDVRAANVLVVSTQPLRVVLADFGLSQRIARRRPAVCCSPAQSASVSPTSSTAVTDVGYDARHRADADSPPSVRSHAKMVVGPVQWTAPEVLTGRVQGVTTASDVYMFGGLLFELLTGGQHPYFWVNGERHCCRAAALLALCASALASVLSRVSTLCRGAGVARG
jgi:serine/threonine protein kinase